jgi:predicted enzyme related to lactoylglutathione lyase
MQGLASHILPGIYRPDRDSSSFAIPRVFARAFCSMGDLARMVKFYKALAGLSLDQDISLPADGVHVVAVGGFLIVALDPQLLSADRREMALKTAVTMIFADVDAAVSRAVSQGAEIVQPRWIVPHGAGYRIRHADCMIVEYLEHRPSKLGTEAPGLMFATS